MGLISKQMTPDPAAAEKPDPSDTPAAEAQEPEDIADGGADEATEQDDDTGAQQPGAAAGGLTVTPQSVQAKLHLQPKQVPILQRIVIAGMKIMFNPKTHKLMLDTLKGDGDIVTKLGQGITGLVGLLMKESQNAIPGELLIPAGIVLMAHAADYVNKAVEPITDADFGNAVQLFVHTLMHVGGMDADKAASLGEKAAGQAAPAAPGTASGPQPADDEASEDPNEEAAESPQDEAAEEAQEQPSAPAPQVKGLIRRGMQ